MIGRGATGPPRSRPPAAWPVQYRTFAPCGEFGPCEELDCNKTARGICPECRGEYCIRHADHTDHTGPADDESDASDPRAPG